MTIRRRTNFVLKPYKTVYFVLINTGMAQFYRLHFGFNYSRSWSKISSMSFPTVKSVIGRFINKIEKEYGEFV